MDLMRATHTRTATVEEDLVLTVGSARVRTPRIMYTAVTNLRATNCLHDLIVQQKLVLKNSGGVAVSSHGEVPAVLAGRRLPQEDRLTCREANVIAAALYER